MDLDRPSSTASRPDIAPRSIDLAIESGDVERRVARYVADPSRLFRTTGAARTWKYIILHHSGESNGGLASIDRFHRETNGWDECGYHFVIGNGTESGDGEIEVGSRWPKQKHGAHTKPQGVQEYNEHGIGICLVGNFNEQPPTPKQVEAARRLVAYLQLRYRVAPRGVTTHGNIHGSHTQCPGKLFPFDRLISRGPVAIEDQVSP
jgi:N-acetyl-anhydromuramyl-L-alanine amidase AmpD